MPKLEPTQLVPIVLGVTLYARRALALRRRGRPVPAWKIACFGAGVVVLLGALESPIDTIGEERLFSVHMIQHVLIGDVAPFLIVLGLSGPLLRPLLAVRGVYRLRVLMHPFVALPLWAGNLAAWHVPYLYDATLAHSAVHALEHALFFAAGAIVWATLFELLPGPRWFGIGARAAYLSGMWFFSLGLSSVFLWSSHPFYEPYVRAPRMWGLSPLADQRLGGGVMLLEGSLIMLGVLIWLGLRWFEEAETRQRALESRDIDVGVPGTGLREAAPLA
ncbi:MAG: cytochrome c oxidase assembly protein [Gaiellaceae bacterium]